MIKSTKGEAERLGVERFTSPRPGHRTAEALVKDSRVVLLITKFQAAAIRQALQKMEPGALRKETAACAYDEDSMKGQVGQLRVLLRKLTLKAK